MIELSHSTRNPSGFNRGDKGYYGDIYTDDHAIIIFGEDEQRVHALYLQSGEYLSIPKTAEFISKIAITRARFWGNFIKPRKK